LRRARNVAIASVVAAGAGAAWSLFEAQWVELDEVDVPIEGLPTELDGFRILHLSDFHLGTISFNGRALGKAIVWATSGGQSQGQSPPQRGRRRRPMFRGQASGDGSRGRPVADSPAGAVAGGGWTAERSPKRAVPPGWAPGDGRGGFDLVVITGDLLSRRRGAGALRAALGRLAGAHGVYAVLGNHDIGETRDPFVDTDGLSDLARATLLLDNAETFEAGGRRIQVVGVEPRAFAERRSRPQDLADPAADLRILLCHFPDVAHALPAGAFHLILAGHLHGGQICVPTPWGKLGLEHLRAAHWEGLSRTPAGMLYVSRGLGTSFVPLRFLARPQATALTLKASTSGGTPSLTPRQ
jgi:predicted MPP superfamily phosphohydrolase